MCQHYRSGYDTEAQRLDRLRLGRYNEGGIYACRSCNNIKFTLYVLKVSKLYLLCLPMLVDSCSLKLCAHKIPRHMKLVRFKCASHIIHDALFMFQFLSFM